MQWTSHCVPRQSEFVGVLFGLWPRFCCFGFSVVASLFPLAKRKSGWGICGSSCLLFSVVFVCCWFDLPAQNGRFLSLYKCLSDSLCSCKDRAFSATSAKLEEKKRFTLGELNSQIVYSGVLISIWKLKKNCWLKPWRPNYIQQAKKGIKYKVRVPAQFVRIPFRLGSLFFEMWFIDMFDIYNIYI